MRIEQYKSVVFDCDGVVLNSNKVKTQAFFEAALPYGEAAAQALVDYHVANGGVSRYKKFAYFLCEIVPLNAEGPSIDLLLDAYASKVREGLLSCDVDPALDELRVQTHKVPWLIVSGGDQVELREVFASRQLDHLFDGGIFGSPDSKEEILTREMEFGRISKPAIFIGDSRYDHKAAVSVGLDFVFAKHWTEFQGWELYCCENKIDVVNGLANFLR